MHLTIQMLILISWSCGHYHSLLSLLSQYVQYNIGIYLIFGKLILGVGEAVHGSEQYTPTKILGEIWSPGGLPSAHFLEPHMLVIQVDSQQDYMISELILLITCHTACSGKGKGCEPEIVSATKQKNSRAYLFFSLKL